AYALSLHDALPIYLVSGEPERDRCEELRGLGLSAPVVGGAVTHLHGAARDGIEHLERGDELAGGIDAHAQPPAAHSFEILHEAIDGGAEAGEIGRPRRDDAPLEALVAAGAPRAGLGA